MKEQEIKKLNSEKISGLNVSESSRINIDYNLSQKFGLSQIQSDIFILFLEGDIRRKRAGLSMQDFKFDSNKKSELPKTFKSILKEIKESFELGSKIAESADEVTTNDAVKALDAKKYFERGEELSRAYEKSVLNIAKKEYEKHLPEQESVATFANKMIQTQGSPEAIKLAVNLFSFHYLNLQKAVKNKEMTNEEMKIRMEEIIFGIKIKAPLDSKSS